MKKNSIEETKRIIEKLISAMKSDRELFTEKTDKEIYTFFINALEFILSDYKRVLKENELYRTEVNCTEQLKQENEKQKELIEKMKTFLLKENKMCEFLESEE